MKIAGVYTMIRQTHRLNHWLVGLWRFCMGLCPTPPELLWKMNSWGMEPATNGHQRIEKTLEHLWTDGKMMINQGILGDPMFRRCVVAVWGLCWCNFRSKQLIYEPVSDQVSWRQVRQAFHYTCSHLWVRHRHRLFPFGSCFSWWRNSCQIVLRLLFGGWMTPAPRITHGRWKISRSTLFRLLLVESGVLLSGRMSFCLKRAG